MTVAPLEPTPLPVATDASDLSLATQAATGDRRAFERLYRSHVNRVFAVCARMVNDRALAEELTVADITAGIAIDFMKPSRIPLPEDFVQIRRWHAELTARPSWKA